VQRQGRSRVLVAPSTKKGAFPTRGISGLCGPPSRAQPVPDRSVCVQAGTLLQGPMPDPSWFSGADRTRHPKPRSAPERSGSLRARGFVGMIFLAENPVGLSNLARRGAPSNSQDFVVVFHLNRNGRQPMPPSSRLAASCSARNPPPVRLVSNSLSKNSYRYVM